VRHEDSGGQISAAQYDAMAADYAASNAEHACNADYERPAMIAMIGEVAGRRLLDAGCGSGPLAVWLAEHGARVTAFDGSGEMAALARRRLGEDAGVHVADLARPLTFAAHLRRRPGLPGGRQITETWREGTGDYEVTFWRRPLSVMHAEIRAGGFAADDLAEPGPLRELERISPSDYRTLITKPRFLFFRLRPR
jgi:SAM-dependent methyltransferase